MHLILASLLLQFASPPQQPPPLSLAVICAAAISKVEMMLMTHPSEELRRDMDDWRRQNRLEMICQSPDQGNTIVPSLVKGRTALIIGPGFILAPDARRLSPMDDLAAKQLILYGAYVTLRDHFNGSFPMRLFQNMPDEEAAEYIWNITWRTGVEEWTYAKKHGITHLMDEAYRNVQKYGEQRGFLEGFYEALGHSTTGAQLQRYKPYWTMRYTAEKQKILKQRAV
jgi:hypothetical protein